MGSPKGVYETFLVIIEVAGYATVGYHYHHHIVLSIIIILLSYILAVQKPETEKLSTYECGFEPYEDARHTFDVKFYLIAILFIVFDIETMFLIPWTNVLAQLDLVGF